MAKLIGWTLMIVATLAGVADWNGFRLPTVGLFFEATDEASALNTAVDWYPGGQLPWLAWLLNIAIWVVGAWFVASFSGGTKFRPLTIRRMQRFREIKRGYFSLLILVVLAFLASLDFVLVGSDALAVKHNGKWVFPAFSTEIEKGQDFGLEGEDASGPPNYRDLRKAWKEADSENLVILPPWPYAPTGDAITALASPLKSEGELLHKGRSKFNGYAAQVFDIEKPEKRHLSFRFRDGLRDGRAEGWNEKDERVYGATYRKGELVEGTESWTGQGSVEDFLTLESSELVKVNFSPAPPSREHWLGTTAQGYDVVSYLYGGLQANFQAALLYIPLVYGIGVTIGLLMGYFGGTFDLVVQLSLIHI